MWNFTLSNGIYPVDRQLKTKKEKLSENLHFVTDFRSEDMFFSSKTGPTPPPSKVDVFHRHPKTSGRSSRLNWTKHGLGSIQMFLIRIIWIMAATSNYAMYILFNVIDVTLAWQHDGRAKLKIYWIINEFQ